MLLLCALFSSHAFTITRSNYLTSKRQLQIRRSMSEVNKIEVMTVEEVDEVEIAPTELSPADPEPEVPDNETAEEKYKREKLAEIAEKKALEVFVTQQTGKYECQACGFIYDEAKGDQKKGILPGTKFEDIEKYRCPDCGANKKYFVADTEIISGFKENLNYGIGTNNLTGGQKANLIYGGLFAGFLLFMSGYLME